MLRRVALVTTDVSEELSASIIWVTRIGEIGTLAFTNNRRTLRTNILYATRRNIQEVGILQKCFWLDKQLIALYVNPAS
jgi:hypothetical protein